MSSGKENVKPTSKIPVLKKKSMLRGVIEKNESSITGVQRDPLRTIRNENVDANGSSGPSRRIPVLNTRYVTYRDNRGELDWKFEVFGCRTIKNVPSEEVIISASSAENALIPDVLPQSITKKVKKSLRRPHSIGIRDIGSPIATGTPASPPLLNIETKPANLKYPHGLELLYIDPLNRHYAMDILTHLLRTERKLEEQPEIRTASRACVINWIVKVQISSDNPAVIQQACWYLDKYLSSAWVTTNKLQVIAATCFWIATKVYGGYVSGRKLVKYSGHAFIVNELIAAERHILRKINFEVQTAVPQDYVPYFALRCGWAHFADINAAATFLCLCGLMVDKTINKEYPSVVAAAAVKISLVCLYKTTCKDKLESCCIYKAAEKKATNITKTCDQLYAALRVIRSAGYEYKALIDKYAGPPSFVVSKLFKDN